MQIFGRVEPQTEYTFLFLYIIFQRWESFKHSSSTPWGDKYMPSQTFLYDLQCCTNFILTFFLMCCVFFAALNPKLNLLSRFCTLIYFKVGNLLNTLTPLWWRWKNALAGFFIWNSMPNNFYFNIFLMWWVFLTVLSPKLNLLSHFCTLLYFKKGNLSSPLVPLCGDRHMPSQAFCMKFNAKQLLFQPSFDAVCIFGSVEPLSEFTFPFIYIILFRREQSLKPPGSNPRGDSHMCPLIFLYAI